MYTVVLTGEARRALQALDPTEQRLVVGLLERLRTSPLPGQPLGTNHGIDLTGYRKLYAARKRVQLLYRVVEQEVLVEVIAACKPAEMRVYQIAAGETEGSGRRLRRIT
jgi:mRNA interferase RelE/StbE